MDKLSHPGPLSLQGNLAENWRRWKQRFQLYLVASGTAEKDDFVQSATLLHVVGEDALEIYNTFTWERAEDQNKVEKIIEKFKEYCNPRRNVTYERHIFNTRNQQPDETVDHYVTDLKLKAKSCEFGSLTDSLIKDRIVCGIVDDQTRSRLLREPNLTLGGAMEICRTHETTLAHMKSLASNDTDSPNVDTLQKGKHQTFKAFPLWQMWVLSQAAPVMPGYWPRVPKVWKAQSFLPCLPQQATNLTHEISRTMSE